MKYLYHLSLALIIITAIFTSCQKESVPSIDDFFLKYEIPEVPVVKNYTVGAYYRNFIWSSNVTLTPALGKYLSGTTSVYTQHISQAQQAGIDFFTFDVRSKFTASQFTTDITFINQLLAADATGTMKFAFIYNFSAMALADNSRIEVKAGCLDRMRNDFKEMAPYFQKPNYMKVNGASVVVIKDAHNLYADNNAVVYQTIRSDLKAMGIDLYIIGEQISWTPPARYDFRFKGAVDAITHTKYVDITADQYERYIVFPQMFDQALLYSSNYFTGWGVKYVPCISPSFSRKISTPTNTNYVITKNEQWFKDICNVAKGNSTSGIVMIDSFNDWNYDSQVESDAAGGYGETYLKLVKEQFKIK